MSPENKNKHSWSEASKKINQALDQIEDLRNELKHIQKPYTVLEIIDKYSTGDYNAELLLQHSLRILINNETQSHE